ncbi:MAG: hypothetical protein OWQ57_08015 [Sulfobacillus sp.]|nr:hypothetical protein [Sulfobacillus sp.]
MGQSGTDLPPTVPDTSQKVEERNDKDLKRWQELAQTLAEAMKMQAENERLRIEKVDAVAQENLRRILDKLDQLEAESHPAGRGDEGAAGGSQSLVG